MMFEVYLKEQKLPNVIFWSNLLSTFGLFFVARYLDAQYFETMSLW